MLITGAMGGLSFLISSPETLAQLTNSMPGTDIYSNNITEMLTDIGIPSITIWHILAFIFYFLSGYFIFATLFAAAASTIDSMQDTNSVSTPLSLLIIVPIIMISPTVMNPNEIYVIAFSLFPFFAPILMTARIMAISIPV